MESQEELNQLYVQKQDCFGVIDDENFKVKHISYDISQTRCVINQIKNGNIVLEEITSEIPANNLKGITTTNPDKTVLTYSTQE
jgi:hypothetical protein